MDEKPKTGTGDPPEERPAGGRPKLTVIDGGAAAGDRVRWPPWRRATGPSPATGSDDPGSRESTAGAGAGTAVREACVICGVEAGTPYVWMDWGPGREAICGRACAERLLDALDAFLERP